MLAVLAFVGFLYVRPVQAYLETRDTLAQRSAEVRALEREQRALRRRLAVQASDAALLREARRLGYVRPGEKLYIVKGVAEWRRAHARRSQKR